MKKNLYIYIVWIFFFCIYLIVDNTYSLRLIDLECEWPDCELAFKMSTLFFFYTLVSDYVSRQVVNYKSVGMFAWIIDLSSYFIIAFLAYVLFYIDFMPVIFHIFSRETGLYPFYLLFYSNAEHQLERNTILVNLILAWFIPFVLTMKYVILKRKFSVLKP